MRNRAKCKLCKSIIESFHLNDYVDCKCGEISIHGGLDKLGCSAKDFANFLRIDDEGNEILVTVKSETQINEKPSKQELIDMLDDMTKKIEELPQNAMNQPINHYDLYSFMLLVSSILKCN